MTAGSIGGSGIATSECWEGVRGIEYFDGERPISDIPANAGAPDARAGCSRR